MNGVITIGGLVAVVMFTPRLATAQSLSSDNAYVLKATARQATTTAPLTLTFSEPFAQRRFGRTKGRRSRILR